MLIFSHNYVGVRIYCDIQKMKGNKMFQGGKGLVEVLDVAEFKV